MSGMSGAPEYELRGVLEAILPAIRLPKERVKVPFVVLSDTTRPQRILLEAFDAVAQQVQQLPLQEKVQVRFAIEGWLWHPPQGSSRYITRLVALRVERVPEK